MRVKADTMIKFGYVMLAFNMFIAGVFWLFDDRPHVAMFMGGSMLWIVMILVWYKVKGTEE
jgi:hypothetical protein